MASGVRSEPMDIKALIMGIRGNAAAKINSANRTVMDIARQLAPVSQDGSHHNPPGFMRDHIVIIKEATNGDLKAAVEAGADYSIYVELGTEDAEAQPFMSPAFEEGKRQLRRDLESMGVGILPPKSLGIRFGTRLNK